MIKAHVLYSGTVQGVGFRYTVQRYAINLNLKGWVKNLANGDVEMVVEGSKDKIDQLCEDIHSHYSGYIRNKEINYHSINEPDFKEFRIAL
jgi:acylphosphatase